jgi:ankyrin repeat protein
MAKLGLNVHARKVREDNTDKVNDPAPAVANAHAKKNVNRKEAPMKVTKEDSADSITVITGGVSKSTPPAKKVTKFTKELLHYAESGDAVKVASLIAAGAKVNAKDHLSFTPLMKAAQWGRTDCIKALIAAGADITAKVTPNCKTALILAVENGYAECVKALIAAGADLNMKDHVSETALMKAAEKGDTDCVKALIDGGADLSAGNSWNKAALHMAAEKGHVDCVKALIAAGADVNAEDEYGNRVLKHAHSCVKGILRAAGAKRKIDYKQMSKHICIYTGAALAWAAVAFGIGALEHWLSPPLPIWGSGLLGIVSAPFIAFCLILLAGYSDEIDLPGFSDYNAYRKIMLFAWATVAFGVALLLYWLSPWFPTWAAAGLFGLLAAPIVCPLALLLPEPVPLPSRKQINEKDHIGRTPLMRAAEEGNLRRLKALIRRGADLNAKNYESHSCTALLYATEKRSAGCLRALVAAGADTEARDYLDRTALIASAESGHVECVKALIEGGANLEAHDNLYQHETALMKAAENHHAECVKALVDAGADINAKDKYGKTALDKARYNTEIASILQAPISAVSKQPRQISPRKLLLEGTVFPLFDREETFLQSCTASGQAAFEIPFIEFWPVMSRGNKRKIIGGGTRLLCARCFTDMPFSFQMRLQGSGDETSSILAIGRGLPTNMFESAKKAICPWCNSPNGILVWDHPPYGDVTEIDMAALRELWHQRCILWWHQNDRTEGLCDSCGSQKIKRGDGYCTGSNVNCKQCAEEDTNARGLSNLQEKPDYFGTSELRRARNLVAGKSPFEKGRVI